MAARNGALEEESAALASPSHWSGRERDMVRCFDHLGARCCRNQVKGFHCREQDHPRCSVEKVEHKIARKVVQNTRSRSKISEASRLQGGNSFRNMARVLRTTRYMVGWSSTGIQMGAFEATLKVRPGTTAVR
jgi:hypothetical protein